MKVKVRLDTLSDIKGFVNAVSPIATEVHLTDGNNLTVSAKSIFRKYFNLNDWMLHNCSPLNTDDPYEVVVSKDNLDALLREIEPIAEALQGFTYSQISYYEDNVYPQDIVEKFYEQDFSPVSSNTFAAGHKLRKLYRNVLCMKEMLEDNDDGNFYITFYSSF